MRHIDFDKMWRFRSFRQGHRKAAFIIYLVFVFVVTVIVTTIIGVITIETELKVSSYFQQFVSDKIEPTGLNSSINDIERSTSQSQKKLVCYYASPSSLGQSNQLYPNHMGNGFIVTKISIYFAFFHSFNTHF